MKLARSSAQSRRLLPAIFAAAAAITALAFIVGCSDEPTASQGMDGANGGMPPAPVTISSVELTSATHTVELPARARGSHDVVIRAQVAGILLARKYAEGEYVEQGQTLFQIDPEPYQLALDNANAGLAAANANQSQAQREWNRLENLYKNNAVSTRELDQARAAIDSANATLLQAESRKQDAERNLRYTRVEAPLSGIAAIEYVSAGNLVSVGNQLTSLIQANPIHLHFAVAEHEGELIRKHLAENSAARDVYITLADGSTYAEIGSINYINSSVNQRTAQIELRAAVANPEQTIRPGQFVRVTVALQEFTNVALINPTAVSQGAEGAQVFVVSNGETAEARPVILGPVIDNKQVILSGLTDGDQLVINGHVALNDGAPVSVTNRS